MQYKSEAETVLEEAASGSVTLERDKKAAEALNAQLGSFNFSVTPGHSGDEARELQAAFCGIRNELSISARNLIRNVFAENPSPIRPQYYLLYGDPD